MSIAEKHPTSCVLKSKAWDASVDGVLLRKANWRVQAASSGVARSHTHTLRRLFEDSDLAVDAVFCLDRRPTLCILNAQDLTDTEVERVRRRLWNLGATTLLMVETTNKVRLYSTLAKPERDDHQGAGAELSEEVISNLEVASLALNLTQLVRRVETGAIYRSYTHRFDPAQAVDKELLTNLRAARDILCPNGTVAKLQQTHQLIGRFLFSCYLLDRGIVGSPYLKTKSLPEAKDMQELLNAPLIPATILEKLFNALHRDFNGSLFGMPYSQGSISNDEVKVLSRLLAGENLRTGQLHLGFKLYDFSYIPVELISSIYEEFLGAEASAASKPPQHNQLKRDAQRASGAYYTPPRLAELTVDIATEGWDTLLDKRCLDPACGSGIFLVILFVRMAEEWRLRNIELARNARLRYDGLLKLLEYNLRGFDNQPTACSVTCFSLYLAFLDQMEPKEIRELREELEQKTNAKILPRILWEQNQERPRVADRHYPTVRECDFFEVETTRIFDLVIGNPPWVSRKPASNVEKWLYSEKNPFAKDLGWRETLDKPSDELEQTLFPAREVAAAFMWKAGLHAKESGRVCQVLPSRVFISANTNLFQAKWLNVYSLSSVWLLADYRLFLFPTAVCPCFIARYSRSDNAEMLTEFEFVTPKVERTDPRAASLPVQPEDQKSLSQKDLLSAAKNGRAGSAWKQSHWGTPRDVRLLERLLKYPKLNELTSRPPRMRRDISPEDAALRDAPRRTRWWKGQGYQPRSKTDESSDAGENDATDSPFSAWWPREHLYYNANTRPQGLILAPDRGEAVPFGERSLELRRSLAPELTRPPLVLVNTGFTTVCYSDSPVVFQHAMQAIAGPRDDEDILLFLTAYLDSPLAKYIAFHAAANLGIEREKVLLEEILDLPFPLPEQTSDPDRSKQIIIDCAKTIRSWQKSLDDNPFQDFDALAQGNRQTLFEHVSEYFDLCKWEMELVEDTAFIFLPSSTPPSSVSSSLYTAAPSEIQHRSEYAETLTRTFRAWTREKKKFSVRGHLAVKLDLALLTLTVGGKSQNYSEQEEASQVETIIQAIQNAVAHEGGTVFRKLRGFAYYEANKVHLLKPLTRRHWTRTAALNDADEILSQMMEEDGWHID